MPRLFTSSSWWQNQTPRARARQLWLLLRGGLHDFVEKVGLACGPCLEASFLDHLFAQMSLVRPQPRSLGSQRQAPHAPATRPYLSTDPKPAVLARRRREESCVWRV